MTLCTDDTEDLEWAIKELDFLRCWEPHGTGLGSCRCTVNDTIDEIQARIRKVIDLNGN